MEVLEALLGTETLFGIVIIGALIMSIRSIMAFTRTAAELRPRLNEVERELAKLRNGMQEKRKTVDQLNQQVTPVQQQQEIMQEYYEELQQLSIEHEKEEQKASENAASEQRKRIQRKKMGFDDSGSG